MQDFSELFRLDTQISYLNHAAVSPWPACTEDAVRQFAEENARFGAQHYPAWLKVENTLRKRLATLIGIDSTHEIALAKSTSEALSIIAYGLNWDAGDEVLICDQEFPSNRIVWESLAQYGVKTKVVTVSNDDPAQALIDACSNNTKLISISSVQYASGIQADLMKLSKHCKHNKILLCVDAIQSLGALPFDQKQIEADFIVADGHKWMMAAEGLALLYVKESLIEALSLKQFGWHMVNDRGNYNRTDWQLANNATRFECGSPNMLGIHALNASLGLLLDIGMDEVSRELQERVDYLIERLNEIPNLQLLSPENKQVRAGIVSFQIEGYNSETLYKSLMENNVVCACRGGGVRFSPHFYTREQAMDMAVKKLSELIA